MTNQYFLDFYEFENGAAKKVAEVDITYKSYDDIQYLVKIEREYYGRYPQIRRALCAPTAQ